MEKRQLIILINQIENCIFIAQIIEINFVI